MAEYRPSAGALSKLHKTLHWLAYNKNWYHAGESRLPEAIMAIGYQVTTVSTTRD